MQNHEIDIEYIRSGSSVEAFEAAKRIIAYEYVLPPEFINELAEIVAKSPKLWPRIAATYTLGFIDTKAITEPMIRAIATNTEQSPVLRDHAEEALYYFAQRRRQEAADRSDTDASYSDMGFDEWRAQQTDLPADRPTDRSS